MDRHVSSSARNVISAASASQTLKTPQASSSGDITGKKSGAGSKFSSTVPPITTSTTTTATPKASSPTSANGKSHVTHLPPAGRSPGPETPTLPSRLRRGPRQPWTDQGSLSPGNDDADARSNEVQYVLCKRATTDVPSGGPATPVTAVLTTTNATATAGSSKSPTRVLRNGRVTTTPPAASSSSDLIMAQGGPPQATAESSKSPASIATPTGSIAGVTPTLSNMTGNSGPGPHLNTSNSNNTAAVATMTTTTTTTTTTRSPPVNAAGYNLLSPGAPQPQLRLARAGARDTHEEADGSVGEQGLPKVLGYGSISTIPEIAGVSNSAMDSSTLVGTSITPSILNHPTARTGGSGNQSSSTSANNNNNATSASYSHASVTKGGDGPPLTVTVADADGTTTAKGRTPSPARSPGTAVSNGSYQDLDTADERRGSQGSIGKLGSKRRSGSVSPVNAFAAGAAAGGDLPVQKLSAVEQGTGKANSRASSKRNLLGSFRRNASNKDLAASTNSPHAPLSRTASAGALRSDDARPPSGPSVYQHRPCGLFNFGATCYMNAALQCIMHTPTFVFHLDQECRRFKGFTSSVEEVQAAKASKGTSSLASSFRSKSKGKDDTEPARGTASATGAAAGADAVKRQFTATSALTDLALEKPRRPMRALLQDIKGAAAGYNEQFKGNGQNDAHELLRTILYVIHEEVNRGKGRSAPYEELKDEEEETEEAAMQRWLARLAVVDTSVVYDLFGGVLQSTCECLTCKRLSRTFDPFLDLSIPVHSEATPVVEGAKTSPADDNLNGHNSPTPPNSNANNDNNNNSGGKPDQQQPHQHHRHHLRNHDSGAPKQGLSRVDSLETDALEGSGGSGSGNPMVWQSGGQGFAKPMALPTVSSPHNSLASYQRDRNGSITRDELGSLCLNSPAPLIGSCSVDDIVSECFARETKELMAGDNKLTCERCKAPRDMIRRCKVATWPKVLVLHLKRFTGAGRKDFTKVTYPQTFTLPQNRTLLRYRLCGVVCHSGSERFGHYTSYVCVHKTPDEQILGETTSQGSNQKSESGSGQSQAAGSSPGVVQRLHAQLETWYLCNDERISQVDAKEALSALENAYILFYNQM